MASKIEWTDATWNPIVGCSILTPGCKHCYAMRQAHRLASNPATPHYAGTTEMSKAGPVWTGKVAMAPDRVLLEPLRRKKPTMYFVNSMGDLFHEDIPDEWIDKVFAVMALCPQHTFQCLTKRAERMREYLDADDRSYAIGAALGCMLDGDWIWNEGKQFREQIEGMISLSHGMTPDLQHFARDEFLPLPNVWLGVSAERQREADERTPHLVQTPAAVRFVSAEPLLGPINFFDFIGPWGPAPQSLQAPPQLDWIIVGGESGHDARPMHVEWADSIAAQCKTAGVHCFVKQLGACPTSDGYPMHLKSNKGGDMNEWPDRLRIREMPEPKP